MNHKVEKVIRCIYQDKIEESETYLGIDGDLKA